MSLIHAPTRVGFAAGAATFLLVAVATLSCGYPQSRSPSSTAQAQPSATEGANPATIDPTAIPTQTQPAHVPPPPDQLPTPRPTDPPITRTPRPRLPTAMDIKVDGNGKYYADVDGCRWAEYGRFTDELTSEEAVGMQTPCLPDGGLHYVPATGAVRPFIR